MLIDVVSDRFLDFCHALENSSAQSLLGEHRKEALNDVEPGTACRREMNREARVTFQPGFDLGVFMCRVVV